MSPLRLIAALVGILAAALIVQALTNAIAALIALAAFAAVIVVRYEVFGRPR